MSSNEIKTVIHGLAKVLPKWIKIFTMPKGTLVQLFRNQEFSHGVLRETIQKHFNQ